MRLPAPPPDLQRIRSGLSRARMLELLGSRLHTTKSYPHWDDLRHRPPPDGLSAEEWWFQLRTARTLTQRPLPLQSPQHQPFALGLPDVVLEHLHLIDQGASGHLAMEEVVASPADRSRYLISSLMEEAIASSQLEGASTSRVRAKEMLRTDRSPTSLGEQMILNNFVAIQRIQGELAAEPLTPARVLELHRLVTADTLESPDLVGRIRRPDEDVRVYSPDGQVLHTPPPAEQLPARLQALCDFANGDTPDFFIHPVVRSVLLHFWLAHDHPFVDGNGRTARALFYWSMLRNKYWLAAYLSISRLIKRAPARYARSILLAEIDLDATYFVVEQLRVLREALDALHQYLQRKSAEIRRVERQMKATAHLNARQLALISHALRHPDGIYTFRSHQNSHRITYQTARTDLLQLHTLGLLVQRKRGRQYVFHRPDDLPERLEQVS